MELKLNFAHTYIFPEDAMQGNNRETTVCKAIDKEYAREVFIKAVKIKGETAQKKQAALRQAMTEIKAMTAVETATPFIPRIYDASFDMKQGMLYIVIQRIPGKSLRDYMKPGKPALTSTMLGWMVDLCDIMTALERNRIQNKDIKPENILIWQDRYLYLIDFDISIAMPQIGVGTELYRAPETRRDFHEMGRSKVDIFSTGVMLYEMACGTIPKFGEDYDISPFGETRVWDTFVEPKEKKTDLPEVINDIIVKCMKLRPEDRYTSASALKYDLMNAKRRVFNHKNRR